MRRSLLLSCLFSAILSAAINAQQPIPQNPASSSGGPLTGRWVVTADYLGTPLNADLNLTQQGDKLTGELFGDKLEGTVSGSSVHFLAKDERGGSEEGTATVQGETMSGTVKMVDGLNPSHPFNAPFTAKLATPYHASTTPKTHEFTPTVFYRQFSPANKPVLTIAPGDTIHTTTVDAGGTDEKGVPRVLGGNPETGPFYVGSAQPGDTLVVHIVRLRLNRDWAISDDGIVPRALDRDLALKTKDNGKAVRWHIDTDRGVATPEQPGEHLTHYSVPLKPMLGCVGVAPGLAAAPPGTGDSGGYGGNMDFNEIIEGATVYLPVHVPGAFLYFGDGTRCRATENSTGMPSKLPWTSLSRSMSSPESTSLALEWNPLRTLWPWASMDRSTMPSVTPLPTWRNGSLTITSSHHLSWPKSSVPPPNTKSAKPPTATPA
jgi:hypothetical protein